MAEFSVRLVLYAFIKLIQLCVCVNRCSDVIGDENIQEEQAAGLYSLSHAHAQIRYIKKPFVLKGYR